MRNEPHVSQLASQKKALLVRVLDELCAQLDLTDSQYQAAKDRYHAIGKWLAESDSPYLQSAEIYLHGSVALGTAIKPIARNEFDVDLVCFLPTVADTSDPAAVKTLIGDRLKSNGRYDGMLEEKRRCWRINYANEFHLDITPAIPNSACANAGELVPDKTLASWKPTNPRRYKERIEQYAALRPRFLLHDGQILQKRADVQPFPEQQMSKPFLKRIIQLMKRNRDQAFASPDLCKLAPISVILTTLASWSYARCVTQHVYADAFDLILDVVRRMPELIDVQDRGGQPYYIVQNETTAGENFAERWNDDQRLANAFFRWHETLVASIGDLLVVSGQDYVGRQLQKSFGVTSEQAARALSPLTSSVNNARDAGSLLVAPALGVVTSPVAAAVAIRSTTFFGR